MLRCPRPSGLCMLLALLLLYNPFLALFCSHSHSSLHLPQRNRATVGSSELQHFSPVQQEETPQVDLKLEERREEVSAPAGSFATRGFDHAEEITHPDLLARVWSRPPPTL